MIAIYLPRLKAHSRNNHRYSKFSDEICDGAQCWPVGSDPASSGPSRHSGGATGRCLLALQVQNLNTN